MLPLLQESERVMFQFDGVTGKASLKISDVTIHDLGEYRCNFNNPLGTAETKGNLLVKSELPYGPRREKTCVRGFRQSDIQIGVLSYRD